MGKKNKAEEGNETYEVWISAIDGWKRVEEHGNGGVFTNKQRCLLLAESKSHGDDVVETMVIERRPVAVFNGPAVSVKHRMAAIERKKEEDHGTVSGSGSQKDDVLPRGPELLGEASPGGRPGEGTPAGPG
jgi:hypothetical protein